MNIKLRKSKALWQGAFLVAGTCFAASVQAQVSVVEKPLRDVVNDPFQSPSAASSKDKIPAKTSAIPPAGLIVYPSRVPVKGGPQRQPFDLVVRRVGGASSAAKTVGKIKPVAVYRVTPPLAEVVFDPQFSSDGRVLLFKVGWPYEDSSTYRLLLWDIARKKLLPGPKDNIVNRNVAWSQDGRFLAYILGGDFEGNLGNDKDSLQLTVYDRESGKSRVVASNPGVTSFAWTPQNTLLFFSFSPEAIKKSRKARIENGRQPAIARRPQLMEVAATEGEPKAVADNAYGNLYYATMLPLAASPDGKWIAFYAWPESQKVAKAQGDVPTPKPSQDKAGQAEHASLYLLNRSTGERFEAYSYNAETQDFLTWTPDSKRLILTRNSYEETSTRGKGEAKIIAVDTQQTPSARKVATLHLEDYQGIYRRSTDPQFEPLRTSSDGRFLIIKSWQAKSPQPGVDRPMTYPSLNLLQTVELATGKVTTIARTIRRQGSSIGLDWNETLPANTTVRK